LVAGGEERGIWFRHAWRTQLGELDRGIFGEPSASAEPANAYVRDTDYYFVAADAGGGDSVAPIVVGRGGAVLLWLAAAVYRTRD
jgi:hypothetical protein